MNVKVEVTSNVSIGVSIYGSPIKVNCTLNEYLRKDKLKRVLKNNQKYEN